MISVTVAERELDDYDRDSIRNAGAIKHSKYENNTHFGLPSARNGYMRLVETCQIEDMLPIHQMLMEEGDSSKKGYTGYDLRYIAVHYLMKDGSTMTRHYYTHLGSPVMEQLKNYGETPEYRLGVDNPDRNFNPLNDISNATCNAVYLSSSVAERFGRFSISSIAALIAILPPKYA